MLTNIEKEAFVKEFLIKLSPFMSGGGSDDDGSGGGGKEDGYKFNPLTDFDLLLERVVVDVEDKYRLLNYFLLLKIMLNLDSKMDAETLKVIANSKALLANFSLLFQEILSSIKNVDESESFENSSITTTTHLPILIKLLSLFDKLPLTVNDLLQFKLGKMMKKLAGLSNPLLDDSITQAAFICARWKIMAERIDATSNINIENENSIESSIENENNTENKDKNKKRKVIKRVSFASDSHLVQIRIFDVEDSDWGAMGHSHHQAALEGGRLMDRNEASNAFKYLAETMEAQFVATQPPPLLEDGFDVWKSSKRKSPFALMAEDREKSALSIVYFGLEDIPSSPSMSMMDKKDDSHAGPEIKLIPVGKVVTIKRSISEISSKNSNNSMTSTSTNKNVVKSPPQLATDILANLQNIIQTQGLKK